MSKDTAFSKAAGPVAGKTEWQTPTLSIVPVNDVIDFGTPSEEAALSGPPQPAVRCAGPTRVMGPIAPSLSRCARR